MQDSKLKNRHIPAESLVSICPAGQVFPLPEKEDYARELKRIQRIVREQRRLGREIVLVMGVGFVGAVMAGVIADTVDPASGKPTKFVIGMQRPSTRSFWKIPYLNRGLAPVEAEDPEVAPLIHRCVKEKKTLIATFIYEALSLADVVVVDVQCDYHKESLEDLENGHADIKALEESLKIIGEKVTPDCLVLIETTVPPGTTEYIAYPIIKKAFEERGLDDRAPSGAFLRESDAGPGICGLHSGFLEGVQRNQRDRPGTGEEISVGSNPRGEISPYRPRPPHRERNL